MPSVSEISLAPGLLVAMPHLVDPNFNRAVVLMVEHTDEGSFGLVLNRATDMAVPELLQMLDIEWRGDERQMVWSGGPVMPTSGWVLHEPCERVATQVGALSASLEGVGAVAIAPSLHLSTSPDNLRALAEDPPARLRFLLGYAGWGPGQLAQEMASGSWLHADLDTALIFDTPAPDMWSRALRSIGVDPESIVQSRGVH